MNKAPLPPQASLHSKRAGTFLFVHLFLGIFVVVGLSAAVAVTLQSKTEPALKFAVHLFWMFPLLMWWLILRTYRAIRVEQGMVYVKKAFGGEERQFAVSDISGHAILKSKGAETLRLRIKYGEDVDIHSSGYSNYREIKSALVQETPPDPLVQAQMVRRRSGQMLIFLGAMLVASLVGWGFLYYEANKLPLTESALRKVAAVLSEKPFLDKRTSGSGNNRKTHTYLVLKTTEFPDNPFELEGAALHAARSEEAFRLLEAQDSIWALLRPSDFEDLGKDSDAVEPVALSGKGMDFLTLDAYNVQNKMEMSRMLKWVSVSIGLLVLLIGWKYWRFRNSE